MSKPSESERCLIVQFRERMQDLNLGPEALADHELMRWIRARRHNLDKAESMFRRSIAWRAEHGFDDPAPYAPPPFVLDSWKITIAGLDRVNSPVILLTIIPSKLSYVFDPSLRKSFWRYAGHMLETSIGMAKGKLTPEGYPVTQTIGIVDCGWVQLSMAFSASWIGFLMELFTNLEANFPERVKKIVIIHGGRAMQTVFNIVKPVMAEETRNKLGFCRENVSEYLREFAPTIDLSILCPCWGGTKACTYDFCPLAK